MLKILRLNKDVYKEPLSKTTRRTMGFFFLHIPRKKLVRHQTKYSLNKMKRYKNIQDDTATTNNNNNNKDNNNNNNNRTKFLFTVTCLVMNSCQIHAKELAFLYFWQNP